MFWLQAITRPPALSANKQARHGASHPTGERARDHSAQAKRGEITAAIWGHGAEATDLNGNGRQVCKAAQRVGCNLRRARTDGSVAQ